jgi:glycosyltransferase involved in cell wall biosynthesis
MTRLSIIILTKNEELHIGRAMQSLAGLDCQVFVVDSGSTDRTVEIAESLGATTAFNPWINYASQFAWGMASLPERTPWVMRLDADEILEPGLAREIQETLPRLSPRVTGVNIRRKQIFMGRWIRFGGRFPVTLLRIWRDGAAAIESRWMDEHMLLAQGEAITLRHCICDFNLKDLSYFIEKHNGYADREAIDMLAHQRFAGGILDFQVLMPAGQPGRKRRIKSLYWALPMGVGPFLYILYRYFVRLGFLDGNAGLIYHFLQGFWYRMLVDVKVDRFRYSMSRLPPGEAQLQWLARETGLNLGFNGSHGPSADDAGLLPSAAPDVKPRLETGAPLDITLIVLTLNEEKHLPRLFQSIDGLFARIIVVDSYSTDRTIEIAKAFGADVYQHPFLNHADQFAWGMTQSITTEWTMKLDADEVLEPGFADEFRRRSETFGPQVTGIELWWKVVFWKRRIRFGGRSPAYLLRVWKTRSGSMEQRWMDEHIILQTGHSVRFANGFMDWNLNNTSFFISKHNGYATREAVDFLLTDIGFQGRRSHYAMSGQALFKRKMKQNIYYRLHPLISPFIYFLYRYFLRAGFRDGREGLVYHLFQGFWYRFLVGAKIVEFRKAMAGATTTAEKVSRLQAITGVKIEQAHA